LGQCGYYQLVPRFNEAIIVVLLLPENTSYDRISI